MVIIIICFFYLDLYVAQILSASVELSDDRCTKCETEMEQLRNQVSLLNEKVSSSSKVYLEILVSNLKKDLKIKELREKLIANPFDEFVGILPSATVFQLNKVGGEAKNDSNFILKAMRGIYGEDLSRLENKTYSGRRKEALTPEKRDMMKNLFDKRIDLHERDSENVSVRKKCFAKHVKNAIATINYNL